MFRKKKSTSKCLDNSEEAENNEVDCFLCQEKLIVKSCEYSKHLEKQHGVFFGVKEIIKAGDKYQNCLPYQEPVHETGEGEPKIVRTDADTVKEMVEMKFLKRKEKVVQCPECGHILGLRITALTNILNPINSQ